MGAVVEDNDMFLENEFGKLSLYVGDLDSSVEEFDLYNKFNANGEVSSVRICRDRISGSSLGYAYVNFHRSSDAEKAMKEMNFVEVKGKPMRIMFSNHDPSMRRSGRGNVFVKNLDKSFDNKQLFDLFSSFGSVLSCKVARDAYGVSKGYGFVQFESESSLISAVKTLNGSFVGEQYLHVCPFVSRRQWDASPVFTNVYVKNLAKKATDDDLKTVFGEFGSISSAVVMRDGKGKSRRFGFVSFEKSEAAATAVEKMNGTVVDEKELYVARAQRKKNRVESLKAEFKSNKVKPDVRVVKGVNLYVKNLDDGVNDEKLQDLFSEFGTVTSCKVMVHLNGMSKGVGFVELSTSEEASAAMLKMNGKMVGKKPIYVSLAQRKEERKLHLQPQFSDVVLPTPLPYLHQHPPIFSQAATSTTALLPPFRGYNNFQPQIMFPPRFSNGFPTMHVPNFMVPQHFPPPPPSAFLLPQSRQVLWNQY
ncbi:unnamed protein product [Microthlaspi erraticum]|uniref:RRM domain-containing protein n=1 Tax=Microthlaspi erraticum TaxID=1685480 RepID=A0A6D2HXF8_9BRAS|nr:unnamed protein product [Microthlaspi erraticum]